MTTAKPFARLGPLLILLALSVPAEELLAKPYKAAEIYTRDSYQYGKYVIRMQAASGSGVISNFFTYKNGSEQPSTFWEEIDIEVFGQDGAQTWQSNIITGVGQRQLDESVHEEAFSFASGYHTFTLEWTPEQVRWLVDGRVIRSERGGQVEQLTNPQSLRFNIWPPDLPEWVGPFDPNVLPVAMSVNWIEYHRWSPDSGFTLSWRDDFDTFDSSRWIRAAHTFEENQADFVAENAIVRDGYLLLALTTEDATGFASAAPTDDGGPLLGEHSGSYVVDRLPDQGFFINIGENDAGPFLFFAWFTYRDGEPFWLVGSAPFEPGAASVEVLTQRLRGPQFLDFSNTAAERTDVGTMRFTPSGCDRLMATYEFLDGAEGQLQLDRLTNTAGLPCE